MNTLNKEPKDQIAIGANLGNQDEALTNQLKYQGRLDANLVAASIWVEAGIVCSSNGHEDGLMIS